MMRLAAAVLVTALVIPALALRPSPPITWLAAATLVVGGAGVVALSVPVVTAGASLAVIAYALALLIVEAPFGPVAAIALGATLVLLLALVHFAGRIHGAAISLRVIASQLRQWLGIVAIGVAAALGLGAGGALLAVMLQGATLPVVAAVATLGAVITVAGVLALLTREDPPMTRP
jgi:hypothetical protein